MIYHPICLPQFSRAFNETLAKIKSEFVGDKLKSSQRLHLALPDQQCRQFSLSQIEAATNNFHQDMIIGLGTYGDPIYRGIINDGTLHVAVKCFYKFPEELIMGGGARQFRTEVQFLCQLCHPNLVSLIGFCDEQHKMILLHEHSGKGSLYSHLYCAARDPLLWKQRLEICIGAARGLHYLHTGAKRAVIYYNINSRNILLDHEWAPKLSEFGYSLMGLLSTSNALIKIEKGIVDYVAGGYTDPDEFRGQTMTDESDVYSFAVVLFEVLLFGRKESKRELCEVPIRSPEIYEIFECIQNRTIYDIIDPYLKRTIAPDCFTEFVQIACSCVGNKGNERPAMGEVEVMLEHALELQNKADSKMKCNNPPAGYVYGEVPFQSSVSNAILDYAENIAESCSYSNNCCNGGYLSDSDSDNLCR